MGAARQTQWRSAKIGDEVRIGRWELAAPLYQMVRHGRRVWYVDCRCECGVFRTMSLNQFGRSRSCGCAAGVLIGAKKRTHGESKERLYHVWIMMRVRCSNPDHTSYKHYGGRGILVCDEWQQDFATFRDWCLANNYRPDLEIDRIDNDGPYAPWNCRWVTRMENHQNKRGLRKVEAFGEVKTMAAWARDSRAVASQYLIRARLERGWTPERAIVQPPKKFSARARGSRSSA